MFLLVRHSCVGIGTKGCGSTRLGGCHGEGWRGGAKVGFGEGGCWMIREVSRVNLRREFLRPREG